ncbi:microfibril-associated glycoprotein 4-like isoform X1 [Pseudophryne corroboree]|uniref:microfibril-associated glycoprotein 4-like isoform X1 n=1 Tax=Pseudophryne corroboree TaxID=495146 RepID=UPI0030818317
MLWGWGYIYIFLCPSVSHTGDSSYTVMKILIVFALCHIHHITGSPANGLSGEPLKQLAPQHKTEVDGIPKDCQEIWDRNHHTSDVYIIYPQGAQRPLPVYCDMTTNGTPWTVFQRRLDGSVDFQKPWLDYVNGFGNADGEYWLGLQNIYLLTVDSDCELRVDLEDCAGRRVSALYSNFSLSRNALNPESDGYRLYVGAVTDGGAGDALAPHVEHMFSTFDKDQDEEVQNCAEYWGGGFWYHAGGCAGAGLNARYKATGPLQNAFSWTPWVEYPETLRASQMKMRRVPDSN